MLQASQDSIAPPFSSFNNQRLPLPAVDAPMSESLQMPHSLQSAENPDDVLAKLEALAKAHDAENGWLDEAAAEIQYDELPDSLEVFDRHKGRMKSSGRPRLESLARLRLGNTAGKYWVRLSVMAVLTRRSLPLDVEDDVPGLVVRSNCNCPI